MAGACMAAMRIASQIWIEEQTARPMTEVVADALTEMAREFR
jgi:hypothetical protein